MRALNEEFLLPNYCFGCGPDNPEGMHIKIFRDPIHADRLVGSFTPRENLIGLPGIVHGGIQFLALDCMAGWATNVLRGKEGYMPLTTSASMSFRRPVTVESDLRLMAEIVGETKNGGWTIAAAIADDKGVLSEGEYEYVIVPNEKFARITGLDQVPAAFQTHEWS